MARPALTPNDPQYNQQWGLTKIGAPAWDVSTGSSSVVIATVDSGIDLSHQDLLNRLWANPGDAGQWR